MVKNRNEKLCRKCNCTLNCNYTQFIFDFRSVLRNSRFLTSSSEDVYKILNDDVDSDIIALFNDLRNVCKHLKSGFYNFGKGADVKFQNGSDWDELKRATSKNFVHAGTDLEFQCASPLFEIESFNVYDYFCCLNDEIYQMSDADAQMGYDLSLSMHDN